MYCMWSQRSCDETISCQQKHWVAPIQQAWARALLTRYTLLTSISCLPMEVHLFKYLSLYVSSLAVISWSCILCDPFALTNLRWYRPSIATETDSINLCSLHETRDILRFFLLSTRPSLGHESFLSKWTGVTDDILVILNAQHSHVTHGFRSSWKW